MSKKTNSCIYPVFKRLHKVSFVFMFMFILILLGPTVSASDTIDFHGYVMNASNKSQPMEGVNVTFTVYEDPDTINDTFTNQSEEDGWFNVSGIYNFSKDEGYTFGVEFVKDDGSDIYVGPSLPQFMKGTLDGSIIGPGGVTQKLNNNTFYLREGAMINITTTNMWNETHEYFGYYQIKDEKTGYIVEDKFFGGDNMVNNLTTYVYADKNYSMMIAPNGTLPVNTKITTNNLSNGYHHHQFNTTENSEVRLNGTVMIDGKEPNFTNLYVLVYLMDQSRMIFMGDQGSAFLNITDGNDEYNATSGYYNISTIGIADGSEAIVMPVGFNSSGDGEYYSGFKNVNLDYEGPDPGEIDFNNLTKMRGNESYLRVDTFGNAPGDFEGEDGFGNITANLFKFNVLDSENNPVEDAFLEIQLDYSSLNMTNFTFITSGSNIEVPLLHDAGIKRINVFSRTGAPLKTTISNSTLSDHSSEYNLTLKNSMEAIDPDTGNPLEGLFIDKIELKDSCFVPNYNASKCSYFGATQEAFDPFGIVMSGAKMSFVMGNDAGITVMYKNVDMLASGPPDVAFDSEGQASEDESTFAQAWRFGSSGPEIYDEVIVGIPYTPGSSTQTGFDESSQMNLTIDNLYNAEYSSVWNSEDNNTTDIENADVDSELYNFKSYLGTEYENYLNGTYPECDEDNENLTNGLCYKDTTNNMVWFRIPHFSGVGASPTGAIITADETEDTPGTGSGGSGTAQPPKKIHSWTEIVPGVASVMKYFDDEIGIKEITINVNNPAQNVKITVTKHDDKPAEVSVEKDGKVNQYLQIDTENLNEHLDKATITAKVEKSWLSDNNVETENIVISKFDESEEQWNELETIESDEDETYVYFDAEVDSFSFFAIGEKAEFSEVEEPSPEETEEEERERSLTWLWILIVAVIAIAAAYFVIKSRER